MLTIAIDGPLEDRLKRVASNSGVEPQVVVRRVLEDNLPNPNQATLALLAQWDAAADPAEREQDRAESERLMQNLDRNRAESEGPLARRLWP